MGELFLNAHEPRKQPYPAAQGYDYNLRVKTTAVFFSSMCTNDPCVSYSS